MTLSDVRRTGAIAIALAFLAQLFGNVVGNAEDKQGGLLFFLLTLAICAVLAVWLFGRVVPQSVADGRDHGARRALVVAVLAALAWGLFWSGVPFILAPAAIALGIASRSRGGGAAATAAIVIGAIALLASAGMVVGDELGLI